MKCWKLALYQAFFEHVVVTQPEVRDIGGAEAEDVFQRATNFAEMEVDPDAFEQVDECLSALRKHGPGTNAHAVEAVIGDDVKGIEAGSVAHDMEKSACFRRSWCEFCG
jgi:hypothetical protein